MLVLGLGTLYLRPAQDEPFENVDDILRAEQGDVRRQVIWAT
jgi:hypothetical protein